jgi:hypothetical protein
MLFSSAAERTRANSAGRDGTDNCACAIASILWAQAGFRSRKMTDEAASTVKTLESDTRLGNGTEQRPRVAVGRKVPDVSGGFRGIDRHIQRRVLDALCCNRFGISFYQDGVDQVGFPTAGSPRKGGCSGAGSGEGSRLALIGGSDCRHRHSEPSGQQQQTHCPSFSSHCVWEVRY